MESINSRLITTPEFLTNPLADILLRDFEVWKNHRVRLISSPNYNTFFDYSTGKFYRCGRTLQDDPNYAEIGPEILDMEISTVCHGITHADGKRYPCKFCYKSNSGVGKNMTFETFRTIFLKMPPNLTQIAFGIGDIEGNPDLEKILDYCTNNEINKYVVPNLTINGEGLNSDWALIFRENCGAIAVSHYDDNVCYNAVKMLTDEGNKQVNIHQMISQETYDQCFQVLKATKSDPRLAKLNAVVFLSLKKKGRGEGFTPITQSQFSELVQYAMKHEIPFGFDSCSALKFLTTVQHHKKFDAFKMVAEPCESTLFSSYINVDGIFFPCSFSEGTFPWEEGLNVIECEDFIEDIWHHPSTIAFRENLIRSADKTLNCRQCPIFQI